MTDTQKTLSELARAKAIFQQRTLATLLTEGKDCDGFTDVREAIL